MRRQPGKVQWVKQVVESLDSDSGSSASQELVINKQFKSR